MRNIGFVAACLILGGCADGWTNWRFVPKATGGSGETTYEEKTEGEKRSEYYASIDGYDVYVKTSIEEPARTYRSMASFARYMGAINYDAGYPALVQAAETVAHQRCANGYYTISRAGHRPGPNAAMALYDYALTYQCRA